MTLDIEDCNASKLFLNDFLKLEFYIHCEQQQKIPWEITPQGDLIINS